MLELLGITKELDNRKVLDNVSLTLASSQTTVLIGPSGCGKSTLIRIILGLVTPDAGQVIIEGQTLTRENVTEIRRRVGYVVQQGGLFPHLTIQQNLGLLARNLGWNSSRIKERASHLLELVRLSPTLSSRYPSELSGGQRQRIGLARALMLEPFLLLLDEPLGALDPLVRRELQEDLRAIFSELGKAVLLVTHDLHEADFFAGQVAIMNHGRILQQGDMRSLLEHPTDAFVTRFIEAQRKELA